MAKRKAAGTMRRKSARKSSGAGRKRTAGRKTARRKAVAKKTTRRKTRAAAPKRSAAPKAKYRTSKRAVKRARPRLAKKAVAARKPVARKAVATKPVAPVANKAGALKGASSARRARTIVTRKAPALDRARRTVQDDDIVPTPPSSLDLNRTASAARSGRRELSKRLDEHTETGPALTAGDVDADWESAYSVGDEAPGGDNPTPDQDVVDDIGKAVGVQYEDNEELKGEAKIAKRDKHRWELDPASAEDYDDR